MPDASPSYCAALEPVTDGEPRPLWSVMIPTYNCADYLRETLASVLSQDPGPDIMQIEVVDDCSTADDPRLVVEETAGSRVSFFRQSENVGYIRNFETCLARSQGRLIHLLHGDDLVRAGFYQRMQGGFERHPEIGAAICRHIYMDEDGHWRSLSPLERSDAGVLENWLETLASGQRVATPAVVVRREVYERLGGFDRRFTCAGEDWEMWVRIAAHFPVWFEPEPLAAYRMKRSGSLTGSGTHRLVVDMQLAVEIIDEYISDHLPPTHAAALLSGARKTYARWALEPVGAALESRNGTSVLALVRQAYRCSPTIETVGAIAAAVLDATWQHGQRSVRAGLRKLKRRQH